MSDFNTWEEIQEWMISCYVDEKLDSVVAFFHADAKDLVLIAHLTTGDDDDVCGYCIRLAVDENIILDSVDSYGIDVVNEPGESFFEKLKLFCPNPTYVTIGSLVAQSDE